MVIIRNVIRRSPGLVLLSRVGVGVVPVYSKGLEVLSMWGGALGGWVL